MSTSLGNETGASNKIFFLSSLLPPLYICYHSGILLLRIPPLFPLPYRNFPGSQYSNSPNKNPFLLLIQSEISHQFIFNPSGNIHPWRPNHLPQINRKNERETLARHQTSPRNPRGELTRSTASTRRSFWKPSGVSGPGRLCHEPTPRGVGRFERLPTGLLPSQLEGGVAGAVPSFQVDQSGLSRTGFGFPCLPVQTGRNW